MFNSGNDFNASPSGKYCVITCEYMLCVRKKQKHNTDNNSFLFIISQKS